MFRSLLYRHWAVSVAAAAVLSTQAARAAPPEGAAAVRPSKTLAATIVTLDSREDRDRDFLKDALENELALHFRPYVVFDTHEHHTQSFEPVTVFQVRPNGCVGFGCKGDWKVGVTFVFLWATDGGYGESSDCSDAHNGDNQSVSMTLTSSDQGRTWRLKGAQDVSVGDENARTYAAVMPTLWPATEKVIFPYVFFSSHKHHQYRSTWNDEQDSIYSSYGCNDDVDGGGRHFWPCLAKSCTDANLAKDLNNVGEPESHPAAYFTDSLSRWYTGESVWTTKAFKGGLGDDGGDTSSIRTMLQTQAFSLGNATCRVLLPTLQVD